MKSRFKFAKRKKKPEADSQEQPAVSATPLGPVENDEALGGRLAAQPSPQQPQIIHAQQSQSLTVINKNLLQYHGLYQEGLS